MKTKDGLLTRFSGQFWLVIFFEFMERGAYYGVMSFLSVYFSDTLGFAKENVGIIKGVIQPLLYFLPILSGAIADRFGYRRVLMLAFSLLGIGYFLTSQMDQYAAVFIALVVMGVGAGIFKPIISGTIAKLTDEENSSMGFGIYYWSINLGAFLFPLFLVPWLKGIDPSYVLILAALSTSLMIIPTWLFFKDPVQVSNDTRFNLSRIINTLAGAFEIIYSPIYLISSVMKQKRFFKHLFIALLAALLIFFTWQSSQSAELTIELSRLKPISGQELVINLHRNMAAAQPFRLEKKENTVFLTIHKPDSLGEYIPQLMTEVQAILPEIPLDGNWLRESVKELESQQMRPSFTTKINPDLSQNFGLDSSTDQVILELKDLSQLFNHQREILQSLSERLPRAHISAADILDLGEKLKERPFFLLFLTAIVLLALLILILTKPAVSMPLIAVLMAIIWFFPGQTILLRIICSVLGLSLLSLLRIPLVPEKRFSDHWRFLLMILLYSGFWVLYFQMFDSVLWYMRAYVDASALNQLVNGFLSIFGVETRWFFDVEHVTVINAGTIILLQLFISKLVKNRPALPTMITGIGIATIGMAILAVSPHIGVFISGLFLFSIGEMTAHPKFISYVGIIAPADSKGLYMGYNFLYGVFGSAIGGVVGAKMYVHYVERLNTPSTLWLLFSGIGLLTIISLLLYHRFLGHRS